MLTCSFFGRHGSSDIDKARMAIPGSCTEEIDKSPNVMPWAFFSLKICRRLKSACLAGLVARRLPLLFLEKIDVGLYQLPNGRCTNFGADYGDMMRNRFE